MKNFNPVFDGIPGIMPGVGSLVPVPQEYGKNSRRNRRMNEKAAKKSDK